MCSNNGYIKTGYNLGEHSQPKIPSAEGVYCPLPKTIKAPPSSIHLLLEMAVVQSFSKRHFEEWAGMSAPWASSHRHKWIKRDTVVGCMDCGMILGSHGLDNSYEGKLHIKRVKDLIAKHCPTTGGGPDLYVIEAPFECIGHSESEEINQAREARLLEEKRLEELKRKEATMETPRQVARRALTDRAFGKSAQLGAHGAPSSSSSSSS